MSPSPDKNETMQRRLHGLGLTSFLTYAGCGSDRFLLSIVRESFSVTDNPLAVAREFPRPRTTKSTSIFLSGIPLRKIGRSRFHLLMKHRFVSRRPSPYRTQVLYYFFSLSSLWGLWLGHSFFEHRSGMVFVPSIMRALHRGQRLPVGFALIACLHSG